MSDADFVTKNDLQMALDAMEERLSKRIDDSIKSAVKEMAAIFSDGMQIVSERFDRLEAGLDRSEDTLDRTVARVDIHDVDIRQLKRKTGLA